MTKLSIGQRHAIDPQLSCWVEASAGTGKTKVLVDRVLALLLHGTEAQKILCLTFTKAAAAEMRARIQEKLELWSRSSVYEVRKDLETLLGKVVEDHHLKQARSLFGLTLKGEGIKIQTVHAFCQFLLKSFPLEAGLMPHFQIMDDQQIQQVKQSIFHQVLQEATDAEMDLLISHVSLTQLKDIFLESQEGEVAKFIETSLANELPQRLTRLLHANFSKNAMDIKKEFLENNPLSFPSVSTLIHLPVKKIGKDLQLVEIINRPLEDKLREWSVYESLFLTTQQTVRKKILSAAFALDFPEFADNVQLYAERLYECIQQLKKNTVAQLTLCIHRLGRLYAHLYKSLKAKNSWVDYEDLIEKSIALLQEGAHKPWIFYKLEGGIDHILIDEAQDTSQAQWVFIRHLIEEFFSPHTEGVARTLFVVGDSKQSIYSFQGADPLTFQDMKKLFGDLVTKAGKKWQLIDLSTSYRSTEAVLKFVDKVFEGHPLLQNSVKELTYKPHELHRAGQGGRVEVWPLVTSTDESKGRNRWEIPSPTLLPETGRYKLANLIAHTIREWLVRKTWLASKNRPIEAHDIMILVRHRDIFLHDLVRALKHNDIPVSGMDRLVLTEELGVQDLLALGDFCLLPSDDLTLATVLKGPFFAWSEEEVLELAAERGNLSLGERLETFPKFQKTHEQLTFFQQLATSDSPATFYNTILSKKEGRKTLINALGIEVEDIIEEFLNSCFQFEEQYGLSLQKFQLWMRQNTAEVKRQLAQSSHNQVRLMTVHGAKGLQAPIVFLPDTTQVSTNKSHFYWTTQADPFPLWVPKSDLKTGVEAVIQDTHDLQEYYRLLYVAMTRAEDQLYVCGWDSKKGVDERSWYGLLQKTIETFGEPVQGKGKGWFYETPHMVEELQNSVVPQDNQLELILLPEWAHMPVNLKGEEIISPSKARDNKDEYESENSLKARQKGIVIHEILQWILQAPATERIPLLKTYLDKRKELALEKEFIQRAVEGVLSNPQWSRYINARSLREVPVEGWKEGKKVRGIIDLLTIDQEAQEIFIIDYKTGAFSEDYWKNPPLNYAAQLALYASILQEIYPTYKIHKILLWTEPGILQTL